MSGTNRMYRILLITLIVSALPHLVFGAERDKRRMLIVHGGGLMLFQKTEDLDLFEKGMDFGAAYGSGIQGFTFEAGFSMGNLTPKLGNLPSSDSVRLYNLGLSGVYRQMVSRSFIPYVVFGAELSIPRWPERYDEDLNKIFASVVFGGGADFFVARNIGVGARADYHYSGDKDTQDLKVNYGRLRLRGNVLFLW